MKKLKKWDNVIVISGKNKWKISKIFKIEIKKHKLTWLENIYVYLEWVNMAKKAIKKEWFKEITLPIHISNVQIYDEENKRWYRTSIKNDWKKLTRMLAKINKKID